MPLDSMAAVILLLSYYDYSITSTLKLSTGFYRELSSTYGINSTWVKFGTVEHRANSCAGPGRTCVRSDVKIIGIPQKADDVDVPNPKDVISKAMPNIQALQNTIFSRMTDLAVSAWYEPTDDILQVVSMPVFMIQQAINSMANAKSLGQQQEKRDRINLILEILGVVFIFVPFLDDITPELEVFDGIFSTVAAAGNVVLTIQAIIADPTSAPMQLLGLLTAGGTRDEGDSTKMASTRRGISEDDLGKIGSFYKEADDDFQDVIRQSCRL
ncbi:hypothetical protein M441DRAFT_49043 [Trichoderma asperellum CBS 433.97]|uniref:Uncharacterized protein n=1 Tax=Trichoderma asperellum (strain ATCC 204424 / CBS 433.97 / NBRC 101777) TaxID=1042311 RepID=A0A2T3Z1H5_TRIA4|nr:hypothetical protein M441DRAFT_49043 [Trichoderma asperellum CBS 433.97]PTB38652.1 hypothetical protein M441DRAFT_49043 [Trichoderma asperellum CBS 433.97]